MLVTGEGVFEVEILNNFYKFRSLSAFSGFRVTAKMTGVNIEVTGVCTYILRRP